MNAVRGGTVTWRPQPWQDGDGGGGEPLSDSDSEEEDFPDDSTTPLGDYITHGETDFFSSYIFCLSAALRSAVETSHSFAWWSCACSLQV